jgi:uncharacterized membrane protein YhaH (DUF805 family)
MTISQILFSFSGRIPRQTYWLANLGIVAAYLVGVFLVAIIGESMRQGNGSSSAAGMLLFILPMYLCFIWCALAVTVKRWHDRGKSGLWMLIHFVPILGPIWSFIELGCLEGTQGPNEFGEGSYSAS